MEVVCGPVGAETHRRREPADIQHPTSIKPTARRRDHARARQELEKGRMDAAPIIRERRVVTVIDRCENMQ